jgi:hypothetical protein
LFSIEMQITGVGITNKVPRGYVHRYKSCYSHGYKYEYIYFFKLQEQK